jgi:hypothetical protein
VRWCLELADEGANAATWNLCIRVLLVPPSFPATMVQIKLQPTNIPLNYPGSKSAVGAFHSANVSKFEGEPPAFCSQSRSPVHNALAKGKREKSSLSTVNWITGVGDVCICTLNDGFHESRVSTPQHWRKIQSTTQDSTVSSSEIRYSAEGKRSALQRHCDFWDADHDGLIYPWDIYIGFRKLGFNMALCIWAAVTMAICSSYGTQASWLPHPLFAINVDNIHRSRHGSTTATYDFNDEIDMRRFDAIFDKYAKGKDYLTSRTLYKVWAGQCCANDWYGWFAGGLECKCFFRCSVVAN